MRDSCELVGADQEIGERCLLSEGRSRILKVTC